MEANNDLGSIMLKMLEISKFVDSLKKELQPILTKKSDAELAQQDPFTKAKLDFLALYAINSLFWVHAKTSGEKINEELVKEYKKEFERLKQAKARISAIDAQRNKPARSAKVASRMVKNALGINDRNTENQLPEEPPE